MHLRAGRNPQQLPDALSKSSNNLFRREYLETDGGDFSPLFSFDFFLRSFTGATAWACMSDEAAAVAAVGVRGMLGPGLAVRSGCEDAAMGFSNSSSSLLTKKN